MQRRVDWFRILDDLKRQGFSLYALEAQVAIPKSTLIGFWCQVTANERGGIPTAIVTLSAARSK